MSDALGTKTELRSQKNFTGHRLAPWLSHMMVSRQETQRALVTPGEVMQLPQTDAIIMVAGAPPIRAKKLRYYADRNFTQHLLPPVDVEVAGKDRLACGTREGFQSRQTVSQTTTAEHVEDGAPERVRQPEHDMDGLETDTLPDADGALDPNMDPQPPERDTSDTVRRARAADRGDPDLLPEF